MMNRSDLLSRVAAIGAAQLISKSPANVGAAIEAANIITTLAGRTGGTASSAGAGAVLAGLSGIGAAGATVLTPSVPSAPVTSPLPAAASAPAMPSAPAPATAVQASGSETLQAGDPSRLSTDCTNKWLVITVDRHTKVEFGRVWDCTLGHLRMELWDSRDAGSGDLIMSCHTVERGAARNQRTSNSATMILAGEDYGINIHAGQVMKTYNFVAQNGSEDRKPRPALAVYGTGLGAVGARTGICIHHGSSHRWSVGCILLTPTPGSASGDRWRFALAPSHDTQMEFRRHVLTFAGLSTARSPAASGARRLDRVRLIIRESF
ncbi:MAG: hypothetical protein Q4G26_04405 [Paracoccus sp. (in: a-proteobacteria)]|nr:hypothetical protein [Paracoccus sp. (in: a-proteobacteria)]